MSPDLQALDQLLDGDLPLSVVRDLFGDEGRFVRSVRVMLDAGEVRLHRNDGADVPRWRWREVLTAPAEGTTLSITDAGAKRVT
jgi:hypothetical protein